MLTHRTRPSGLDVEAIEKKAAEAFRRSPTIADTTTLALVALRGAVGEFGARCRPWQAIWRGAPRKLPADLPETLEVVRLALECGEAGVAVDRAIRAANVPPDHELLESHRRRGVALKKLVFADVDAQSLEVYAAQQAAVAQQDAVRVARANLEALERQLEDALRVCWVRVRNGGRP